MARVHSMARAVMVPEATVRVARVALPVAARAARVAWAVVAVEAASRVAASANFVPIRWI